MSTTGSEGINSGVKEVTIVNHRIGGLHRMIGDEMTGMTGKLNGCIELYFDYLVRRRNGNLKLSFLSSFSKYDHEHSKFY